MGFSKPILVGEDQFIILPSGSGGIKVVDVSDPNEIFISGTYFVPEHNGSDWVGRLINNRSFDPIGNNIYATSSWNSSDKSMAVISVGENNSLDLVAEYKSTIASSNSFGVVVYDEFLKKIYVSASQGGSRKIDIVDPFSSSP